MNLGICYSLKDNAKNIDFNQPTIVYGAMDYYFTNPVIAIKAKYYLSGHNKNYKFKFIKLPDSILSSKILINTYEDFLKITQPINIPRSLE